MLRTPEIFVVPGLGLQIPNEALKVTFDAAGQASVTLERLEMSLDMAAMWLRVALDQLDTCTAALADGVTADEVNDHSRLASALERECTSGMLAICSAAFALDAFYGALKDRSPRVASIPTRSGAKRPARHKVVAEALRREFKVGRKGLANLQQALQQVFRFRDLAVHPPAAFALPIVKHEVNKVVEWRFVSFGAPSARNAVRAALAILVQLSARPRNPTEALRRYIEGITPVLEVLAARWRNDYGFLTDDA